MIKTLLPARPSLVQVVRSRLEFTFDSYPSKSCVQDLNLFKSDFGSENAYVKVKEKMHMYIPVFQSCLAALELGSSIQISKCA